MFIHTYVYIYIYVYLTFKCMYIYIYVYNYYICIYVYHTHIYICSLCICECPFYGVDPYAQLDPVHYRVPRPASEFERKSFVRFPPNNRKGPSTHQMQTFLGHNLMTFHVYESMSDESWDPS